MKLAYLAVLAALVGTSFSAAPVRAEKMKAKGHMATSKMAYECPKCEMKSMKAGNCPHCKVAMVQGKKGEFVCPKCKMTATKAGNCPHCKVAMKKKM